MEATSELSPYEVPIPDSPPGSPTEPRVPPPLPPRTRPSSSSTASEMSLRSSSPSTPPLPPRNELPPGEAGSSYWDRMKNVTLGSWNSFSSSNTLSPPATTGKGTPSPAGSLLSDQADELDDEDLRALHEVQATLLSLGVDPTINRARRADDALQLQGAALEALTITTTEDTSEWLERIGSKEVSLDGEDALFGAGSLLTPVDEAPPRDSVIDQEKGDNEVEDERREVKDATEEEAKDVDAPEEETIEPIAEDAETNGHDEVDGAKKEDSATEDKKQGDDKAQTKSATRGKKDRAAKAPKAAPERPRRTPRISGGGHEGTASESDGNTTTKETDDESETKKQQKEEEEERAR